LKDLLGNRQALGRRGFQEADTIRMSDQIGKISVLDASPFAGRSHDFRSFHSRVELAEAISPFVVFGSELDPPRDARRAASHRRSQTPSMIPPITSPASAGGGGGTSQGSPAARRPDALSKPASPATTGRTSAAPAGSSPQRRPTRDENSGPLPR
jgi:hypothetical protein